jgi:RNA polymerase sigma factor (sigma-70 family)
MPALWHNISYDKPAGAHLRRNPDAPAGNLARGGGAMNHKPPHLKWLHRLPKDLQQALCDLPKPLQAAVHKAVAACNPLCCPRLYANDWLEELYQEAIVAAWEAQQSYDPSKGCLLYRWGLRVIRQRLQAFCDGVWDAARHECDYPCDEETGEDVEFPDERALEAMEEGVVAGMVREALRALGGLDEQIGLWHLFEWMSEREMAKRLGCSQKAVNKRLQRIKRYLRERLGGVG